MASITGLRQAALRVPLDPISIGRVDSLEVIGLRCRVDLFVEAGLGQPTEKLPFVVDSGPSYTFVSLELARSRTLPVPPPEAEITLPLQTVGGLQSMRVRPGRLRAWWHTDLQGYPFDWPVLFRVDAPPTVPPILGLGGVVKTCQWLFDGTYSPESPHGFLTLSDIR